MIFQGFGMCDGKEINSGPYALDYSAPENQDILAWEEWLTGSLQHIERGKASPDIDLKLRSTVTWKEMADALEEVDDIRAREWERQRVLLNKGAPDRDFSSRASMGSVSLSASNWMDQVQEDSPPYPPTYAKWNRSFLFHSSSSRPHIYFVTCRLIIVHSSSHVFEQQSRQQRRLQYL